MLKAAAVSLLAVYAFCSAQAVPSQAAQAKTRIDGRVINLAGKPLSKATLALVGNNRAPGLPLPPAFTTTSGADGSFIFEDVEPNTYRLFVQRAGYLEFIFSQPDGSVAVEMAAGQQRSIEVKMTAQSFISGKITDEDGEPFPGARASVLRITRVNGKQQLAPLSPVPAGPDGSFSIGNLTAGRYYLTASDPPGLTQTTQREVSTGKRGSERYVTTYYPSALDASGATVIEVPAGGELRNMDIRLQRARVFHIYGRTVDASGAKIPSATLNLLYPGIRDVMGNAHRAIANDGAFEFNQLLPGTYVIQASGPRNLKGHQTVTISDQNIEDLVLTIAPGADIPLSIRIEGADKQEEAKIRNQLGRFTLTSSDSVNDNAMAQSNSDGTFVYHNIGAGTYSVGIGGPEGTYVKSIRFDDQDVTRSLLDTTAGAGALEVVFSAHAAEVTGTIADTDSSPMPGVAVTLWTPGLPTAGTIDQARSTASDAMGKFHFGNLRPGEYRIAAWEKIEPGMGNIPEFHVKFDARATSVTLSEDSHEVVKPVLISREAVEREAASLQ
jgi:protocatechuate 3,4-dioxygenase beta subunit